MGDYKHEPIVSQNTYQHPPPSGAGPLPVAISHPVFSDYSHITQADNLPFVVSLREDDTDGLLERIMPLSRIKPSLEMPMRTTKKNSDESADSKEQAARDEKEPCSRPACQLRKTRLFDMKSENAPHRENLKALQSKVNALRNKVNLGDRALQLSEDRVENFRNQIEDAQARIIGLTEDVERSDNNNKGQRELLTILNHDISIIRREAESYQAELRALIHSELGQQVIFNNSHINGGRSITTGASKNSLQSRQSLPSRSYCSSTGLGVARIRNRLDSEDRSLADEVSRVGFGDDDSEDDD
jgi:hypothetical protein